MESIDHESRERIDRFGEEGVLPALREALGQRPKWRGFDARQLESENPPRGILHVSRPQQDSL